MSAALSIGMSRTETVHVDRHRTIDFLGEENRIYSTPSMVNDVEYACWRLIETHLDPGGTSLGVHVSLKHLAATPLGETVTIRVQIESVRGRQVLFSARISDDTGVVGVGEHERALVNRDRTAERLATRRAASQPTRPSSND